MVCSPDPILLTQIDTLQRYAYLSDPILLSQMDTLQWHAYLSDLILFDSDGHASVVHTSDPILFDSDGHASIVCTSYPILLTQIDTLQWYVHQTIVIALTQYFNGMYIIPYCLDSDGDASMLITPDPIILTDTLQWHAHLSDPILFDSDGHTSVACISLRPHSL